jgi:ergothioneine biosynthesis protein EgtB
MPSSSLPDRPDARHASLARSELALRLAAVRDLSACLAQPLSAEDQCLQGMPDASPTKWHLAHTTWFFETLILAALAPAYRLFDRRYAYLFNSYYESLGPRQPRPQRGMITRPGVDEVLAYRAHVDGALQAFVAECPAEDWAEAAALIELGINHEQQHQELILTDLKYGLSLNPFDPVYRPRRPVTVVADSHQGWLDFPGGETTLGHPATGGFCYDNETPAHRRLLGPYQLADRLTSCGDYLAFMADGAYRRPELWLADGWAAVQANDWQAPLYWRQEKASEWSLFTLHGRRPVDPAEPVCHISFYEAAAYAAWADARLPTEFEWEAAVAPRPVAGNFLDSARLHPQAPGAGSGLRQAYGDAWAWTRSSYDPYPGFRPLPGAVGEYNGKFMVGQLVLRGGSCASPPGHLRATYRNFFPPAARWQFSGLRLARDL